MRKTICLLSLLPLLSFGSVINGDFETVTDGLPDGWRHGSHDGGQYTFASAQEASNRFFRLSGAQPGGRAFIDQSMHVAAGRNDVLRVRFRYRGQAAELDGFVRIYAGSEQLTQYWWHVVDITENWQWHEAFFQLPQSALGQNLRLQSILYLRGKGLVDYDDYSVTLVRREDLPKEAVQRIVAKAPEPSRDAAPAAAGTTHFLDDFQTLAGDLPAGWKTGNHDGGDYVFSAAQSDDGLAFRITGRQPGGRAYLDRSVAFAPGRYTALKLAFRYRGQTPAIDGFVRIFVDGKDAVQLPWKVADVTTQWQHFEHTFILPSAELNGKALRLQSILYLRGKGFVEYDDYSLTLLTRADMTPEQINAARPDWSQVTDAYALRFLPEDKFVSQLNPPAFSWPYLPLVSYDFEIASDPDFANVVIRNEGMRQNFVNLAEELAPRAYWWRVRPAAGEVKGDWSAPRRVRIAADAVSFPVPQIAASREQVSREHPRIWFTKENLPQMRALAQNEKKEWFDTVRRSADRLLNEPLPPEPTFAFSLSAPRTAEWITAHGQLRTAGERPAGNVTRMAFVYLMTGDRRYGERAVEMLMNITDWDPDGATSYRTHDQVHRRIAFESAISYDWLYGLMSPEQRQRVVDMVRRRTESMFASLLGGATSMGRRPYNSHGWTAFGYTGLISLALLHDEPRAGDWFDAILPWYINLHPLWAGQDGGWFQGNGYWRYTQESSSLFQDALRTAVGLDFYRKPYGNASGLFPIYNLPVGSKRSHFGDENRVRPDHYHATHMARMANYWQDPVLQWGAFAIGEFSNSGINPLYNVDDALEPVLPAQLPPSRLFADSGWVAMHSDLVDPERVSLYFKSSWIGSYNHSHADQNSFVLNAFGEPLLIDSGYYDWYHSPHDKRYARQTIAHNAITVNGGYGQPVDDITAKGQVIGFVHSDALDAVSGEATVAYGKLLDKAVRHIIYLRPDVFVVIDELEGPNGAAVPFEWRFHSLEPIRFDEGGSGAEVAQGDARLKIDIVEGSPLQAQTHDQFIGPPDVYPQGEEHTAIRPQQRGARWPDQTHSAFLFDAEARATLVTVLRAYRQGQTPVHFKTHKLQDALRIDFEDGRRVWVKTNPAATTVNDANVSFTGVAFVRSGKNWLLVDGTQLRDSDTLLLAADTPVWAAQDDRSLSIYAEDDAELVAEFPQPVTQLVDAQGRPYTEWSGGSGNAAHITSEAGLNRYFHDASAIPALATVGSARFECIVNGNPHRIQMQTMRGADGEPKAWGLLGVEPGAYVITEMSAGMHLSGTYTQPDVIRLGKYAALTVSGDLKGKTLRLDPVSNLGTLTLEVAPPQAGEAPGVLKCEAENVAHREVYRVTEIIDDEASGGSFIEMSPWHPTPMPGPRSTVGWAFDVPADGEYHIALRLRTENPEQLLQIQAGAFAFEITQIPVAPANPQAVAAPEGNWEMVQTTRALPLKRGRVQVVLSQQNGQSASLDWVALIPAVTGS